ncbi:MAG: Copper binding protein plastocyanin/azurin family [Acidobacteriota bacterium]|jgi:plastocyanin|nr:Copper binding protein plastocyanin/azurin family [Acidobacteriota bacterium]
MKPKLHHPTTIMILALALPMFLVAAAPAPVAQAAHFAHNQVIVPEEDRFTPFSQTIHAGEAVRWINMDSDDHSVVSDDTFNTAGNRGVNIVLKGTDNNGGKPGTLVLHFNRPGTFVYYCRFHAHLDADHQPAAPGPDGGIQDADGNYGTPMMGIITVLPGD